AATLLLFSAAIPVSYLLAALALRYPQRKPFRLNSLVAASQFVGVALLAPLVSAAVGVVFFVSGRASWQGWVHAFYHWWLGDVIGILISGSSALVFLHVFTRRKMRGRLRMDGPKAARLMGQSLALAIAMLLVSASQIADLHFLAHLSFLPVLWLALTRALPGASFGLTLVSLGGIAWLWALGVPLTDPDSLQTLLIAIAIGALLLGGAVADQRREARSLRRREEQFRALADYTYDWEWWIDPQGAFVYVSPSCERISGYRPEEFMADRALILNIIHPEEQPAFAAHIQVDVVSRQPAALDFRIITRNGETRWMSHVCQPIYSDDGRWLGERASNRDITAGKQAEMALEKRQRRAALLNEITRAALEAASLSAVQQILADRLGELFEADACYITHWDEAKGQILPGAAYGPMRERYAQFVPEPGENTTSEAALRAGHALVIVDAQNNAYCSPRLASLCPAASTLAVPLIADGKWLGAALINFHETHYFTVDEVDLGEQAAGLVALGLAKTRLADTERRRAAELARSNELVTALARLGARLQAAREREEILEILGAEMRTLGLDYVISRRLLDDSGMQIDAASFPAELLAKVGAMLGIPATQLITNYRNVPLLAAIVDQRRAHVSEDLISLTTEALPGIPANILRASLRLVGVPEHTCAIHLPLVTQGTVTGLMTVWGANVYPEEISIYSVFASHVAIALEKADLYAELQRLAITDPLTGLYNRRGLAELGAREMERARRYNRPLAAIMLDIDHFKVFNDTYGHPAGDLALCILAERGLRSLRELDILARYGGEEFFILLPENDLDGAFQAAERLRLAICETPFTFQEKSACLTISLGVCRADEDTHSLDDLIARSDMALYLAKQGGRNKAVAINPAGFLSD
ncbi:MAG: diguanylate cyclase, partial [Chloroflexi bacterium]|nr:diguanylate cyclase [Chloroflexota bacterium]